MIQIEWGDLERTEAIENFITEKSQKLFQMAPEATNLVVHLQITNPAHSNGVATQKVSMELRLPHHQDIRAEDDGEDLYKSVGIVKKALVSQLESRKRSNHVDRPQDVMSEQ